MAVRTRQLLCETCQQPRPFDKPASNHILHLLLSCLTFGLWLIIWFLAAIANSRREYHCRTCGWQPSSLRAYGKRNRSSAPTAIVLLGLGALFIWCFARPASRDSTPRRATATTATGVGRTEVAQRTLEVWPALLATYPDMQGDRLQWRDVLGMTYVAVPDPFWNSLSTSQRAALAKDLDSVLKTKSWTIVTGRYAGSGKMMLDRNHSRSNVLAGQ